MLDDVETQVNTDRSRVYAAGISNGGALAYRLAAQMSDRLAAVAVVAAGDQFAAAAITPLPDGSRERSDKIEPRRD
ncbi:MAG: PHB depolymerase family esterase [Vulcanimicrobiota bacterium]